MINALSSHQLGLLNECRAVAIENSRFYEKAYNAATDDHDKSLIGSAAAQRKVFVEAMIHIALKRSRELQLFQMQITTVKI